MPTTESNKSLPWNVVEKAIKEEVEWLKNTLIPSPFKKEKNYGMCEKCIYRRIAILIVSGKVKARDINSSIPLWGEDKTLEVNKKHGKKWHHSMMELVGSYFQSLGYDITIEPTLNVGRADLGAYKEGAKNLYVEVGTISLPKLLLNLESMEGSTFLVVLKSTHGVDFSVIEAGYKAHFATRYVQPSDRYAEKTHRKYYPLKE